ncbi:MAG: hypothetical protein RLZZ184_1523 [Cyanobacteriota bacterium]|jgi:hypothetical protein
MKAILIKENNETEMINISKKMTLEELQKYVDGYIEWVTIDPKNNTGYYVNEEGKFNKGTNELATKWWYWNILSERDSLKGFNDFISGDVVYMKIDEDGEDCSLTEKDILDFEAFVEAFKIMTEKYEGE